MEQAKERVVVARAALQTGKVDLAQYTICHDSMKMQSEVEVLSDQIAGASLSKEDKLQVMTNLVDRICADTEQFCLLSIPRRDVLTRFVSTGHVSLKIII